MPANCLFAGMARSYKVVHPIGGRLKSTRANHHAVVHGNTYSLLRFID